MLWETRGDACNFGRWERGCSSGTGETREDLSSWGGAEAFLGVAGLLIALLSQDLGLSIGCPSVTRCPGRDTAPSCGRSSRASCSRDPSVRTSQSGERRPRPQKGGGRGKGRARRAEWHSCKAGLQEHRARSVVSSASDGRRNVQSSAAPGDAMSDPLSHRACRFDEHRSPPGAEGGHLG